MEVFFGEVTLETVKGRASYHDISDEIRENIKKLRAKMPAATVRHPTTGTANL